jgi:hypothetical protein
VASDSDGGVFRIPLRGDFDWGRPVVAGFFGIEIRIFGMKSSIHRANYAVNVS